MMGERYDLHIHSLLTEGELVASEIARRCFVLGHRGIAITDHVDHTNLQQVLSCLVPACRELNTEFDLTIIPGVELTHVPPFSIEKLVQKARSLGARLVVVHGETITEPVAPGTNLAAVRSKGVDILAHPGLITLEEAVVARENSVFLELTSRSGHCLTNGHVALVARKAGAELLVNSDAHAPEDLITFEMAEKIALGAGLTETEVKRSLLENPSEILEKAML